MSKCQLPLFVAIGLLLIFTPSAFAKEPADALDQPKLTTPKLNTKNWRATLEAVIPTKKELAWLDIGWKPTLWDAVIEAHKQKKPILLWAMNGHALACT